VTAWQLRWSQFHFGPEAHRVSEIFDVRILDLCTGFQAIHAAVPVTGVGESGRLLTEAPCTRSGMSAAHVEDVVRSSPGLPRPLLQMRFGIRHRDEAANFRGGQRLRFPENPGPRNTLTTEKGNGTPHLCLTWHLVLNL
jgi:hypothetical protein